MFNLFIYYKLDYKLQKTGGQYKISDLDSIFLEVCSRLTIGRVPSGLPLKN